MTLGESSEVLLHRAPSVDDLFAPMWRLEVQQQQDPHFIRHDFMPKDQAPYCKQQQQQQQLEQFLPVPFPTSSPELPTSASDDDPFQQQQFLQQGASVMEEKKQKRMLSNRESARRSRLRKQQHLEDLRSQLVELKTQNSEILSKLNLATQQFTKLNNDNQVLRMHALELGGSLQKLHQKATDFHPNGLHAFGFGNSHLDPPGVAMVDNSAPSAYSLVSGALLHGSTSGSRILID